MPLEAGIDDSGIAGSEEESLMEKEAHDAVDCALGANRMGFAGTITSSKEGIGASEGEEATEGGGA